jgi:hypothetical protein
VSPSPREPDFELDEDLFDFAEVAQDVEPGPGSEEDLEEILASFREAPEEDLLSVPVVAGPPTLEPTRHEAPRAAPFAAPAAEPALAPVAPTAPVRERPEPRAELPTSPQRRSPLAFLRSSRGVIAIALSVTVLNTLMAVVLLRGRGPSDEVRAVASHSEAEAPAPVADETVLPDPERAPALHDHPALRTAREQLARGEYSAARQRAYALLSVIDRLEDPRREEIEGECKFLVAQTLHLEALARRGRTE